MTGSYSIIAFQLTLYFPLPTDNAIFKDFNVVKAEFYEIIVGDSTPWSAFTVEYDRVFFVVFVDLGFDVGEWKGYCAGNMPFIIFT